MYDIKTANDSYELVKINLKMGLPEYEMFQDIPAKESGSTNLCNGLPFEVFPAFIESQLAREFQYVNNYDTPTIVSIFYVSKKPVGYVGLRTEIDANWKKWSGNIFYAIRKTERKKGYGTALLQEALKLANRYKMTEVFIQSSSGNIASQKIIEKNGGKLLYENDGTHYYIIHI